MSASNHQRERVKRERTDLIKSNLNHRLFSMNLQRFSFNMQILKHIQTPLNEKRRYKIYLKKTH